MNRILLLFLFFNLLGIQSSFGQSTIGFEMSYFEDVNSEHSFETIKQQHFTKTEEPVVNFSLTNSTIWAKVRLTDSVLPRSTVFEITNHYCDTITIAYNLKGGTQIKESLGIVFPHSRNKLKHFLPTFNVPTRNLRSPEIYFKLNSRWSMVVNIKAKTKEAFNNDRITTYLIAGLLIGGLILMGIYNLFLFFSTRDFSYILYVCALTCAIFSQGYVYGILIPYISPNSPEFTLHFPIIIMACTGLFCCWFTIRFLEIKKTSTTFYYLLIFGIIFSIFSISLELSGFIHLSRVVNIVEVLGLSTIIFSAALYSLIKGNKIALYFTIAWTFYLAGMIVFALKTVDVLPHNGFTKHFMHVGTFMEVILLSFALGHKYGLVREEKERLERQTREELEELVRHQTAELNASLEEKEVLLKEIHHRVKNNLQIVISLLDLQVASAKDHQNKEILTQSKSRVYSMSLIHQKLYQSENMARVNMKTYLEELFSYLKGIYYLGEKQIKTTLDVADNELSLTQAVPLGLILNELLTNCFKHGLQGNQEDCIHISLQFQNNQLSLQVADSGNGFEATRIEQGVKKSLGLFLVKSLSKQLRGTVRRYSENGLFITELTAPIETTMKE